MGGGEAFAPLLSVKDAESGSTKAFECKRLVLGCDDGPATQ